MTDPPPDAAPEILDDPAPVAFHPIIAALARHRRLAGAAALLWFGIMVGGGIVLSQLDARNGLHVFGPKRWVAGERTVLRVALRQIRFQRFEPLGPVDVTFVGPHGVQGPRQTLTGRGGPFVQGTLEAPSRAGAYILELSTLTPDALLTASIGVHVDPAAEPVALPPSRKPQRPSQPDKGPLKLEIGPTDHVLPGGALAANLTVRATDANGVPVSVPVELALKEGRSAVPIPKLVVTNHHGLATFPVAAMHPTFWFELTSGESRARRRLRYTPTQFALTAPKPLVAPREEIEVRVHALHRSGPAFLDAWHGDRWLATWPVTLSGGTARVRITIPELPEDPAFLWLQVYRTAYLPQQARGGQHLLVTRGDPANAVRWLAGRVERAGVAADYARQIGPRADAHPDLVSYLLGLTERPDGDPPLLADSSVTARQTVNKLKATWQTRFVVALVLSGLLLFVVLGGLVLYNYRDVRRRWVEAGGDVDGDSGTRRRVLVDAGYMFIVLALFLLGMIQVLLSIRW